MRAHLPAPGRSALGCLPTVAIALASGALYVATLAPGLMWGDDAELQRLAMVGSTRADGHAHPMWFWIAKQFARIPFGSIAWRVNLSSAILGAIAVALVYRVAMRLTHRRGAAALAALAFAVSHTQWLHSVRAEVYALFTALLALTLLLFAKWRESRRHELLFLLGLLAGVTLLSHMLIVTALPGLVVGVSASAPRGTRIRAVSTLLAGWLVGCSLFIARAGLGPILHPIQGGGGPLSILSFPRPVDVLRFAAFTAYQFPLAGPLVLWGAWRTRREDPTLALTLVLIALGDIAFGLCFQVPDQYVFYLPAYLIGALFLALGLQSLRKSGSGLRFAALVGALTVAPPLVYRLAPIVFSRMHLSLVTLRTLPGRDNNTYFMFPPKAGERSAERFAREAFTVLPESALVVADWAPLQALRYLQEVEHVRADLAFEESRPFYSAQLDSIEKLCAHRAVFIADVEPPPYYDIAAIRRRFLLRPAGPIFMLERRRIPSSPAGPPQKTVARDSRTVLTRHV